VRRAHEDDDAYFLVREEDEGARAPPASVPLRA